MLREVPDRQSKRSVHMGSRHPDESGGSQGSRAQRTGLVTLLFTDMVGSTAIKQQLGDKAGAAFFDRHHQVVRRTLESFPAGQEIETAGDSFLVTFGTPSDAVQFALTLQAALEKLSQESGVSGRDRVGIHVGEVVIKGGDSGAKPKDLYGIQIDTCSRVMSLAKGGQVLMTRAVFDSARQVLKGEDLSGVGQLEWLNHGLYLLQGLDDAVEICEVRRPGQAGGGAPVNSEKAQRQVRADEETVLGWRPAVGQPLPNTRWVLEKKLGEGGFGEVWLGLNPTTKERRVFKFCFHAERVRFLKRELTLFRLLKGRVGDHPNIVRLHDVYLDHPPFYVEMDYVEGNDLRAWSQEWGGAQQVPLEVRLEIVAQTAEALQAAHDAGVIHRDVKPANILVQSRSSRDEAQSPGGPGGLARSDSEPPEVGCYEVVAKLTDFGIGQVVSEEYLSGITRAGFTQTMMSDSSSSHTGTQLYMAPELLAGKPGSTRSDIYSLGVVLFQLLVGDFAQPVTTDWWKQISDPLLRDDLEHCFAGNPQERFAGAGQLAKNLRALPERQAALVRQQNREAAARKRRVLASLGAGVTVILLLVAAGLAYGLRQSHLEAAKTRVQVVRLSVANGVRLQNQGDLPQAALWFAEALRLVEGDADRERVHRLRCASVLQRSPKLLHILEHTGMVEYAEFSPDGRRVLTTGGIGGGGPHSGFAIIWEVATGAPLTAPMEHDNRIVHASFSPDGRRVVTASFDYTGRVWDAETGRPITPPLKHSHFVYHAEFSPDGGRVVTACWDHYAKIFNAATGEPIGRPLEHYGGVDWASFSPDSRRVVTASIDKTARVWDATTGNRIFSLPHDGPVLSAMFSRDGRYLVTASMDGLARLWDASTGRLLEPRMEHDGRVLLASISADAQKVLTLTEDSVRVWNLTTGTSVVLGPKPPEVTWMSPRFPLFSPNGALVARAVENSGVQVFDAASGEPVTPPLLQNGTVYHAAFSPDSRRVVTAGKDGAARIWELAADVNSPVSPDPSAIINRVSVSPDGQRIVLASGDNTAQLVKVADGTPIGTALRHGKIVFQTRFSPDGHYVATASGDETARVWDAMSGQPVSPPLEHRGYQVMTDMAFSPDVTQLATASIGGNWSNPQVRVWDARFGRVNVLLKISGLVERICFSPDGRWLATAGWDRTARVWDTKTGLPITPPLRHGETVFDAAFSPDRRLLVTGSADGTAHVWDATTGEPAAVPFRHSRPVISTAFTVQGTRVMTMTQDGLWSFALAPDLRPIQEIALEARIIAARRIDSSGSLSDLTQEEIRDGWRQLSSKSEIKTALAEQGEPGLVELQPTGAEARSFLRQQSVVPSRFATRPAGQQQPLDLSAFYNAQLTENWVVLDTLPTGRQRFAGIDFEVKGLIALQSGSSRSYSGRDFPSEISGIRVGRKCQLIHFLHRPLGYRDAFYGSYRIHFTNGQTWVIPVLGDSQHSVVAWSSPDKRKPAHLQLTTWQNPLPEFEVASIDLVPSGSWSSVSLVALTVE
jgi:WD40 repeat protein/class 3 adenylate cyclase